MLELSDLADLTIQSTAFLFMLKGDQFYVSNWLHHSIQSFI